MKCYRLILPLAALALLVGCTQSVRLSALAVPEATITQAPPVDVSAYAQKYAGYDGVMIDVEQTIEHSGIKEEGLFGGLSKVWEYSRIYKERYIILNPEAQWLTTYSMAYKPDKLYILATAPSGQVAHYSMADFKSYKDEDGWNRYKIAIPRIEKGTVIEIGYEDVWAVQRYFPPLDHNIPLQYRMPCEHLKFTFLYPQWWSIALKEGPGGQIVPTVTSSDESNKKTIITYEKRDTPALRYEPFAPSFKAVAPYLQFMVTHLQMGGIKWDSPGSWNELATSFRKYGIKKAEKRSDNVNKLVDSLITGATTDLDKMSRIQTWIGKNIERSGKSNNADPGKTLTLKMGTIYDITGLAQSMLYAAGIESRMVLVHDADDGYFDATYINADQIFAPALHVIIGTTDYALFPWIKYLPASLIPDSYCGQTAIVVSEEGGGNFWTVPEADSTANTLEDSMLVELDTAGQVHVKEFRRFHGLTAYDMRRRLERLDKTERSDTLKSTIPFSGADYTLSSFEIMGDTAWDQPLVINLSYDLQNQVALGPDEVVFQTADLFLPSPIGSRIDTVARQNPVAIPYPEKFLKRVVISYPASWSLATPLDSISFDNIFGSVSSRVTKAGGTLDVAESAVLKQTTQPKGKIADLSALIGTTSRVTLPALVFQRGAAPPPTKP
jgi:hypothetical protein